MIHAYDSNMRPKAQATLAHALDFSTYEVGYTPDDFFSLFIQSGLAKRFEEGDPSIVMGKSGVELALLVLEVTVGIQRPLRVRYSMQRSIEYWLGWALAYYQWETALSFREILTIASLEELQDMYAIYHEQDVMHFVAQMDALYNGIHPQTKLRDLRKQAGLTQEELARDSGVPVKSIQQYEQRRKDINKAQFETVLALARALHRDPVELYDHIKRVG